MPLDFEPEREIFRLDGLSAPAVVEAAAKEGQSVEHNKTCRKTRKSTKTNMAAHPQSFRKTGPRSASHPMVQRHGIEAVGCEEELDASRKAPRAEQRPGKFATVTGPFEDGPRNHAEEGSR